MNLKTLLIVVGLLAAASVIVYVVNRPQPVAATDPRVGQPLLAPQTLEKASRFTLTDGGNTVALAKGADGAWTVASYHDLPADFTKLARFVKDLTDAKLDRLVTQNPELIARLQFADTSLAFADAAGAPLWDVDLGKTADGGGRFVRFGDETKAYVTRLNAWLDTTARNWADSTMVALKPEQVARVELGFPDGEGGPLVLTRAKAEDPLTAENPPAGQQVRRSTVDSLLSSLTSVRFTDTTAPADAEARAAREHQRTIRLTTFGGETVTLALGRKPEQTIVKMPETKPEESGPAAIVGSLTEEPKPEDGGPAKVAVTPTTETIPAGPVFATVTGPAALAKLAAANDRLAFKISEYTFTSLPKTRADIFEPVPAAPAAPADSAPPAPPAEAAGPAESATPPPPAP